MFLIAGGALGWLWKIFASFWFWLDKSIFDLIGSLYDLLILIARTTILSQATISDVKMRIQMLLGIFMLFKVGFSLITYIVNPDDFSDQSKGVGKMVMNTIVSLVLLITVPYFFNIAFRIQAIVLEENIIAHLIFGDRQDYSFDILSAGEKMKFEVMLPFFQPNSAISGLEVCSTIKEDNSVKRNSNDNKNNSDDKKRYKVSTFNSECKKALLNAANEEDEINIENYINGVENGSFNLTFRLNTAVAKVASKEDDEYLFDYKWPLTTVAGVIVCLILISYCIDIAIRSVKLAFLQLISPIPIISYMDPKSGKDGMFTKWYKMCLSTYASLFVRLAALFFGIFVISNVDSMIDVINGTKVTNSIVQVFIIIGVLFFVKQLPKILQDMGIKLDGDGKFNLNPLKRMEEGMMGGNLLKKPNEMLAKGAKGLATAPFSGAKTVGKKGAAALDSMKNGRGFRAGWTSQHGKLYDAYRKKKDEIMPYDAEKHKQRVEGRNEFDKQHKDWGRGRKLWGKLDYDQNAFDGKNAANYKKAYKHAAFADSAMKVDAAKNALDHATREYERLQAEGSPEQRAQARIDYDKAVKTLENAEKDHDTMRKRYVDDAERQDAMKRTKGTIVTEKRGDKNVDVAKDATSIHMHREQVFSESEIESPSPEPDGGSGTSGGDSSGTTTIYTYTPEDSDSSSSSGWSTSEDTYTGTKRE